MAESYSCEDIQVLRGLEAVRRRPGMYVGDTDDGTGLLHMVLDVVGWAVKEHEDGFASYVRVAHVGDALVVEHDGRGYPVDVAPGSGTLTLERAFTQLHGMFSAGLPVANALSAELEATSYVDGRAYRQRYERGEPLGPPEYVGPAGRTGMRVRFIPDETIFGASRPSRVEIQRALRLRAACHPRLTLLHDERAYRAPDGAADLARHLARGAALLHDEPIALRAEVGGIAVDAALLWTDRPRGRSVAIVGDRRCPLGSHVVGLLRGIQDGFGAARSDLHNVYPSAFREVMFPGLVWCVLVAMPSPRLVGQLRERLDSPDAGRLVRTLVSRGLAERLTSDPGLRATLFARLPHANENAR